MEPIINPWLIYAVNMCGDLKTLAMIGAILIVLPIAILGIEYSMIIYESDKKRYIKIGKYLIMIFAVLSFLAVVIPDRETCLAMLAVYYITPDNIQTVQGNIIQFVEQLANAVKEVK